MEKYASTPVGEKLTFQNVKVSTVAYETKHSYKSDNMNTWFSLDQLNNPEVKEHLKAEGYYTALDGELIQYCDSEARKNLRIKRNRESLLENWPDFEEGIHYIRKTETKNDQIQNLTLKGEPGVRQIIDINNAKLDDPKDGWCGLHNIYLTQQSFGNTLIEMNFPRTELRKETE